LGRSTLSVCKASPSRIFDEVDETAGGQIGPRPRRLRRLELAGDQPAAAIVAQRRGEMQGRDAERGPEFDDGLCARASCQHVKKRADLARDGQRHILQASVEIAVAGFAAHQARPIVVGEIGEHGVGVCQQGIGLVEQAVQQGRERACGKRIHGSLRSAMRVAGVDGLALLQKYD
jgi:hypothetical protein